MTFDFRLDRLPDDPTVVTRPRPKTARTLGPCWHCRNGDHQACTGVGCYGCRDAHRLTGMAARGDMTEVGRTRRQGKRR